MDDSKAGLGVTGLAGPDTGVEVDRSAVGGVWQAARPSPLTPVELVTAFDMPWYRNAATIGHIASQWARAHPLHPLVPLRGASGEDEMARAAIGSDRWAPAAGYRDWTLTASEWRALCREDRQLALGVRLGWTGPGIPWMVEVVVKNWQKASSTVYQLFGPRRLSPTASWRHKQRTHFLLIGDDRPADLGLVDVLRKIGPDLELPGFTIRLGDPADPAASLAIPPWLPPRRSDKKQRRWLQRDKVCYLPDSFYTELLRLTEADGERGTPGADRQAAGPIGSRIEARASDSPALAGGQVRIEERGAGVGVPGEPRLPAPEVRQPAVAVEPADDLATLAAGINEHHRRAASSALDALEGARRSGELLLQVKARQKHGQFQPWIEEHCEFGYRTAASYMQLARDRGKLVPPNVQGDALLSLGGALKMLARPRPVAHDLGRPTAESEPSGPRRSMPSDPGRVPADRPVNDRLPAADRIHSHSAETPGDESGDADRIDTGPPTPSESPSGLEPLAPSRTFGGGPIDVIPVADDGRVDLAVAGPSPAGTAGVTPSPGSRRRAGDSYWLIRMEGIRPRLVALDNKAGFDRDAIAWRLLRPVAEEFLERGPWPGEGDGRPPGPTRGGLLASGAARLARARHPREWDLCPDCEGSGRSGTNQGTCSSCSGRGYRIEG